MKNKLNLPGFTIGAAALIVGFAGNVQAIPFTQHNFSASRAAHVPGRSTQSLSLASLTASAAPNPVMARHARGHHNPGAGIVNLPISIGLTPASSPGVFPVSVLHAPLLPIAPINLPPSPGLVATGAAGPVEVLDGGATAALLAGSFGGLMLFRKKLKA
jgi:hypothetical protein